MGFVVFPFDAAARDVVLPVVVAAFLWTLVVAAECCAELADVFFAAGLFFADAAEDAGFAVFFVAGAVEAVPAPAAAEDCASRLFPGHSRQVKTMATQYKVLLSSIRLRSNHRLSGESRRATLACTRSRQRPHFNSMLRSGVLERHAHE